MTDAAGRRTPPATPCRSRAAHSRRCFCRRAPISLAARYYIISNIFAFYKETISIPDFALPASKYYLYQLPAFARYHYHQIHKMRPAPHESRQCTSSSIAGKAARANVCAIRARPASQRCKMFTNGIFNIINLMHTFIGNIHEELSLFLTTTTRSLPNYFIKAPFASQYLDSFEATSRRFRHHYLMISAMGIDRD